ncbi:hypothetical protein IEQ34_000461 [Dendrobium chrysotoxum]|uniref:Uncharacterized protein n=1 Tax=Dendrobium chrysotoxum TaxID=161865 RepID=A0AAV7HT00_DENCH|nr:hypothetical protein IEQ34_000461 [Dendrobium chrysotoxum]
MQKDFAKEVKGKGKVNSSIPCLEDNVEQDRRVPIESNLDSENAEVGGIIHQVEEVPNPTSWINLCHEVSDPINIDEQMAVMVVEHNNTLTCLQLSCSTNKNLSKFNFVLNNNRYVNFDSTNIISNGHASKEY